MASYSNGVDTSAYEPLPRRGHAFVEYKGKMYLVGGYHGGHPITLSSIDVFDPTTLQWQCCKTKGSSIPMEVSSMAYSMNDHILYLFGGYLGDKHVNNFIMLDIESLEWSTIQQRFAPAPRAYARMITMGDDRLLLYGGEGANGKINTDLHIFSIENGEN